MSKNENFQQQYITHHHCNIISTTCFSIIASYYVQLHKQESPRKIAMRKMNEVLGYVPNQCIKVHDKISTKFGSDKNEELLPVIANFTRATARNMSQHQHWLLLHSGTMHTSASSLKHVIKKQLLHDLHPSLLHRPSYDCTCIICKLSKPTLTARGKLCDKTNLAPFQRLHVDFLFFTVTSIRGFTSGLDVTCSAT